MLNLKGQKLYKGQKLRKKGAELEELLDGKTQSCIYFWWYFRGEFLVQNNDLSSLILADLVPNCSNSGV